MGEPRFNKNKRYVNKKGQKFGKGVWEGYGRVISPGWGDFDRDNRTITQYNSDGTKTVFSWEDWQDKQTKDHELRVLQNDRKYGIPYIPSKKMKISIDSNSPTRKNAETVFSENMLDSIAFNAKKAGLPFSTAIGIAAQESSLGHNPSRTTGKSMLPWLYSLNSTASKNRSAASKISYKDTQSPSLLISNWNGIAENPFSNYQYDSQGNLLSTPKDKDYYDAYFNSSVRKGNNYKFEDVSPLYKGFKSYKENPDGYNHGDSKYPNKVKAQSQELVNHSPEIKSYMKKHNLHDKGGFLNNSWDSLSLADKAEMIKVAVANGIITLPEIRQAYNKFAEGGGLNDGDDLTKLGGFTSPVMEEVTYAANGGPIRSYKDWSSKLSSYWGEDINKHDYDYEKYYNDNPYEAYEQLNSILNGGHGHFPDGGTSGTYKKLSHPTYPDLGEKSWSDNNTIFHLSERQAFGDSDRTLDYLGSDLNYNRGGTKVMYKDGYMLPTIKVTPKGSSTELVPNKFHTGWVYSDSPSRAYKYGGYKPSSTIKKKISDWEGSSMKTNRSFEAETKDFNRVIPEEIRSKLSSQQLDALYSYGYNVGMGNLKKRVVPTLTAYIEGKASKEDVQRSMWAKRDNELRGLTTRRNAEREMFGGNYRTKFTGTGELGIHLDPSEYTIPQSFFDNFNAGISLPQMQMPNGIEADPETLYKVPTIDETLFSKPEVTPEKPVYNPQQERLEGLKRMNTIMGLLGQSTPFAGLVDISTPGLLSYVNQIYNL